MRAVESDQGAWFFVCYEAAYITTIPFKNKARARSFLKLMSNIRFEQKVRQSLPPMYTMYGCSSLKGPCCTCAPLCQACADRQLVDWSREDDKLPSYAESEEAVRQHLIDLGLMAPSAVLDRQNSELDIMGMLSQACAPPSLDGGPALQTRELQEQAQAQQQAQHVQGERRGSTPATWSRRRTSRAAAAAAAYNTDERLYGVPLVWI